MPQVALQLATELLAAIVPWPHPFPRVTKPRLHARLSVCQAGKRNIAIVGGDALCSVIGIRHDADG